MAKVLFLDIDGVLRTFRDTVSTLRLPDRTILSYTPACVDALNKICRTTGAKLVVSSTWRHVGLSRMTTMLADWGVCQKPYSMTPRSIRDYSARECYCTTRGEEIMLWLACQQERREPVESFVILDDDDDMDQLYPFLIRTYPRCGLTMRQAEEAIARLGNVP